MGHEAAMNRPNVNRKRSVVVSKKRTSVSLEDSFWASLQAIVRMENTTIEHYIEKIERKRETPNLSSNLRIAVLEYFQQIAARSMTTGGAEQPTAKPNDHHSQLADKVAAHWGRIGSQNQQLAD
jgi:predicted DNA-binding ribbon-helix-helix protein